MSDSEPIWTVPSIFVHFEERLDAAEKLYDARFKTADVAITAVERAASIALAASEKAINKAELAADKRFDSVNEFRGAMNDQAGKFITRAELWAWMVSVVGIIIGIVAFLRK